MNKGCSFVAEIAIGNWLGSQANSILRPVIFPGTSIGRMGRAGRVQLPGTMEDMAMLKAHVAEIGVSNGVELGASFPAVRKKALCRDSTPSIEEVVAMRAGSVAAIL